MARRQKNSLVKQLTIVGSVLAAFQLAYLFLVPRAKIVTIKEAISSQLEKQSIDDSRREQLRIQLSVEDYRQKNQGQLPDRLDELVPVYFDEVPQVPNTYDHFSYWVDKGKYYVGDAATIASLKNSGNTEKPGSKTGVVLSADSTAPLPPEIQKALIESLKDQGELQQVALVYDPTGKRDPFRPFDFAPSPVVDETKTPLERYDISQLKLTAVITGLDGNLAATVENAVGRGFIVKKGIKIGLNSGDVVDIQGDRLIVVETTTDFTGQKKTKTLELKLRTKDQEEARKRKSN